MRVPYKPFLIGSSYRTRQHNHRSLIADIAQFSKLKRRFLLVYDIFPIPLEPRSLFSSQRNKTKITQKPRLVRERHCLNNVRFFFPFAIIAFRSFQMKEPMNNYSNSNNKIKVHPIKDTCTTKNEQCR